MLGIALSACTTPHLKPTDSNPKSHAGEPASAKPRDYRLN